MNRSYFYQYKNYFSSLPYSFLKYEIKRKSFLFTIFLMYIIKRKEICKIMINYYTYYSINYKDKFEF